MGFDGKYADAFKKPVGFDPAVFGGTSPQIGIAPGSSSQPTTPKTLEEALANMLAQRTPEAEAKPGVNSFKIYWPSKESR
jgi:hypothetical protein